MTLQQAIVALREAKVLPLPMVLHDRVAIPTEAAKAIAKATGDDYLRDRIRDVAEWNEPTLRIHASDRDRLMTVVRTALLA